MNTNHQRKIQHLYWRAGFGLSPKEWTQRKDWSIQKNIDLLFANAAVVPALSGDAYRKLARKEKKMGKVLKQMLRKENKRLLAEQNYNWVLRMGDMEQPALLERMSLFWHGHFACITKNAYLAHLQLTTIRKHALGSFRDLVLALSLIHI